MFAMNSARLAGLVTVVAAAFAAGSLTAPTLPALSGEAATTQDEVYNQVRTTFGSVPTFIRQLPKAMLAGAWAEERDLELSDKTALSPKVKALISLAVAAQIPCHYCVWADTNSAKQFGATEEEIGEAVGMAALTRHWSTMFNGLQVDFDTFRKELGG